MWGAGWIGLWGVDVWMLSGDGVAIKIDDVYRLFVFNPAAHVPARHASAELDSLVYEISTRIGSHLQMSLEQFFTQTEPAAAAGASPRLTAV